MRTAFCFCHKDMIEGEERMEQPGFCRLLSIGLWACNVALLAGFVLLIFGVFQLSRQSVDGVVNTVLGIGCITQSLVTMGVLEALLWIIDRLTGTDEASQTRVGSASAKPKSWTQV